MCTALRTLLAAGCLVLGAGGVVAANEYGDFAPYCDAKPNCTSRPTCGQHPGPNPCGCDKDRGGPEGGEDRDVPAGPGGVFAAPPRTGAAVAASRAAGIRGGAITLPEITLRLPSIEFPSCLHFSRGPEMHIDAARAPYVAMPAYATAGRGFRDDGGDKRGPDQDRDAPGSDCTSKAAHTERAVDDCKRQLQELKDCIQQQQMMMNKCLQAIEAQGAHYAPPSAPPHGIRPQVAPIFPPAPVPTPEVRRVPNAASEPVSSHAYDPYPVRQSQYVEEFQPRGRLQPLPGGESSSPASPAALPPLLRRLPPVE